MDSSFSSSKQEFFEQFYLAWPMFISYASRFAMASTDSAFVGHISTRNYTPADYLAAASLADVVMSILTSAPLAFNSVLNALCSQAIGAKHPKMAGVTGYNSH